MPRLPLAVAGAAVFSHPLPVPPACPPILSLPQPRREPNALFRGTPSKGKPPGQPSRKKCQWRDGRYLRSHPGAGDC